MNYREIGYRIQIAREQCEMNQKELAEKLGISQSTLSNYEKGKRRLYLVDLQNIANALGKPTEYFLQPIGESEPEERNSAPDDVQELVQIMVMISELSKEDRKSVYDYVKWFKQNKRGGVS